MDLRIFLKQMKKEAVTQYNNMVNIIITWLEENASNQTSLPNYM